MADCMTFPEDWHDFLKDYSFDDSKEVYTNGSRLIPVFRVEQLIEHMLKAQEPVEPRVAGDGWYRCGNCNNPIASGERVENFYGHPWPKYCEECGRKVKWNERLYTKST